MGEEHWFEDDAGKLEPPSPPEEGEEEQAPPEPKLEKISLPQLLIRIEKIEGKLEMIEELRAKIEERQLRLSEQIGELRTMILDREKNFGELEVSFERIKSIFEEIKPEEFYKELQRKERSILQNQVRIEKLEGVLERYSKELAEYRELMSSIKGFENLVEMVEKIRSKLGEIEESKKYVDRLASKVESIFGELSDRLGRMSQLESKISAQEELSRELVKSVDELGLKIGAMAKSSDLNELRNLIRSEDLKSLEANLRGEFSKLSDRMGEMESRLEGIQDRLDSIQFPKELERRISELEDALDLISSKREIKSLRSSLTKAEELGDESLIAYLESELEFLRKLEGLEAKLDGISQQLELLQNRYSEFIDRSGLEHFRNQILAKDLARLESKMESLVIPEQILKLLESRVEEMAEQQSKLLERALDQGLKSIQDLISEFESKIKQHDSKLDSKLKPLIESMEKFEARIQGLEKEFDSRIAQLREQLLRILDRVKQDLSQELRSLDLKYRKRGLDELLREKESILRTLESLRIKLEEGIITKQGYEQALKHQIEALSDIDARIQELAKLDELGSKIQELYQKIQSMETKQLEFVNLSGIKALLDELRRQLSSDQQKLRAEFESRMSNLASDLETKLNECQIKLRSLDSKLKESIDPSELRRALDGLRESLRSQEISQLSQRMDSLALEIGHQLDSLEQRIQEQQIAPLRSDVERKLGAMLADLESRMRVQDFSLEKLEKWNQQLEDQLAQLRKQMALANASPNLNRRSSLQELIKERERLLTLIAMRNRSGS